MHKTNANFHFQNSLKQQILQYFQYDLFMSNVKNVYLILFHIHRSYVSMLKCSLLILSGVTLLLEN